MFSLSFYQQSGTDPGYIHKLAYTRRDHRENPEFSQASQMVKMGYT
jgi:hypothetical protein